MLVIPFFMICLPAPWDQPKSNFVVINGNETRSSSAMVSVSVNPLMDDDAFVVSVYQGMFGRAPASFEQAYWSQKLGDGSLTKSQMVDELRCREEFRKASDIMISHKSSVGYLGNNS
jgi:hypothetical protein